MGVGVGVGVGVGRTVTGRGAATCATPNPSRLVPAHPAGPATRTVAMYSAAPAGATVLAVRVTGLPDRLAGCAAVAIGRALSSRISSVRTAVCAPSPGRTVTDARYVAPAAATPLTRPHSPRSCPRADPPQSQPSTTTATHVAATTAASTLPTSNG